jgi:hypothetical protein
VKVYSVGRGEGYELCHPLDPDDFERINTLINGTERLPGWSPIPMRIIRKDEGKPLQESDSPWLGSHALIFRKAAIDPLKLVLEANGELLPLDAANVELRMYNPRHVVDALDETSSEVIRFSSGRIMMINRYVLKPEVIRTLAIFKLSCLRVSPTFVHQGFVDQWMASRLKGLHFREVWEGG